MINVTKTYLPPLVEYTKYLEGIWERTHLTNNGPLLLELEKKLKDYLGVKYLFFVNNGTIALQIAIKALALKGEVITTPFSYVATTSSLVWEGCQPIFVDIRPDTFCLDPDLIEASVTNNTKAIVPTHVYGNPCDVEAIKTIADKYCLKVIYDAAHAFGVNYGGKSVLNYGDISTLSFHATKLFHTGEGGAVVTNDDEIAHKIAYLRNFGHNGQEAFWGVGINGKNSELHAAMGLCVLPKVPELIQRRKELTNLYDELLKDCELFRPIIHPGTEYNYAYYSVLFPTEESLIRVRDELNSKDIFPRRYFYPSLNKLKYVQSQNVDIAEGISKRVLCLPLFYELQDSEVCSLCRIIVDTMKLHTIKT